MDLLFRQLNTDYFSNMYFNTSLGFNSRDSCCCCAATWASHLFPVSFTRRRMAMVSEESMELQALSPGWSFKRNLSVLFVFFLGDEMLCSPHLALIHSAGTRLSWSPLLSLWTASINPFTFAWQLDLVPGRGGADGGAVLALLYYEHMFWNCKT